MWSCANDSVSSISVLSNVSNELSNSLNHLMTSLQEVNRLTITVESMKNNIQNMANNIMAFRPVLDSIRDYNQRQENALTGIAGAIQQLMGQMGQIIAKLG